MIFFFIIYYDKDIDYSELINKTLSYNFKFCMKAYKGTVQIKITERFILSKVVKCFS